MRLPLPQSAFSSSLPPPLPPPCFISSTNHMVTAPSNLWGRVCKCVFLSSDLQIVPFIAFVTVKIKVPGWPVPQITESAQGATAGWEPMEGAGPCYHLYVCVCMHVCVRTRVYVHSQAYTSICAVDLYPGPGRCVLDVVILSCWPPL